MTSKAKRTSWHKSCFKKAIHPVDRDEQRYKIATASRDTTVLTAKKRGIPHSRCSTVPQPLSTPMTRRQTTNQSAYFANQAYPGDPEPREKG